MEEDEMNESRKNDSQRQKKHPLKNIENNAKNISKNAEKGSEILKKSGEKKAQQALNQTGKKAATTIAKSEKRIKQAEKMAKLAKVSSKVASTVAKLGPIIATVGMIILIIIAIIGLLVFIITGLGLIMSGLEDLSKGFRSALIGLVAGKENYVSDDAIVGTLSYLQEMDYDLYGYGFTGIPDPLIEETDENGNVTKKLKDPSETWAWGIFDAMDKAERYTKAYKNIRAYLVSDNYAYILQHQNKTLGDWLTGAQGKGLLSVYYDAGLGIKGDPYSKLDLGYIEIQNNSDLVIAAGIGGSRWKNDLFIRWLDR